MESLSSKIIVDLEPAQIEWVKKTLHSRVQAKKLFPVEEFNQSPVYHMGDLSNGYYILVVKGEVAYFVRYKRIKHNKLTLGRQILVWRDKSVAQAAGFASHIFFDVLLPSFGALVADQIQTNRGMEFWQYAAQQAFKKDLFVYVLDRRSTPNQLVKLNDYTQVFSWQPQIWGTTEGHKRVFLVVSEKALSLGVKK